MKELVKIPFALRLIRRFDFPHKKGIMDKIFNSSFAHQEEGWVNIWTGHNWKIDFRNPCHRWMIYDRYADSQFLKWAEKNLPPDAVIVDSGTNIGQFLPYYSRIAPQGKILAFEPSRLLAQWVDECVKENKLNTEVIAKGLGNLEMNAFLNDPGDDTVKGLWNEISTEGGEPVKLTVLRNELKERRISKIDLWKLDVEGYETEALEGAGEYLDDHRIGVLYIEMAVKKNNHQRILDYMRSKGYAAFEIEVNGKLSPLHTVKPYQMDALFMPAEAGNKTGN
jgi:FkbM family methyltransferase